MKNQIYNYKSKVVPTWCPGCPNFLLLTGLQQAFAKLKIPNHNIVVVSDIGCAGNISNFLNTYRIHSLHGRAIPTAIGVKLANPKLTVVVVVGDGGAYGEGLNHLITAVRANYDIKVFVANNHLYSLTTGQASPTTKTGTKTKSTPFGYALKPIDPVPLLKNVNSSILVENVDSKNPSKLFKKITKTLKHQGFALLDISQVCLSFGN
ncbi:2-oxoacid ferredoxin oxidoreductase [Patescibacteria group bacterium]|nr:2-oxoacid ferredoxin oxidoreductase [Patescibacteria group bacterium]MCG2702256.1 thiamine pyrophosphate-dependent enzyme [Candidatus Parcubacteria bacterium]MBU4264730.1 2-oxoacid ferredoxin oxidoreductase [Patescibacteria group bacterium]MBU4390068.1 2-oxoacid ferredoxin oxidoreductase [Patescibacteria group bacterium]MBU4431300.1 2-oxoacid ferredoxin oxidoreductase [Patescibacteria group bacterium]